MSGLYFERAIEVEANLPTLVVLGAGNTLNGISEQSCINALVASSLILSKTCPRDVLFTTGKSSNTGQIYPITESEGMAEVIIDNVLQSAPKLTIYAETGSEDTIGSLVNIRETLEELDIADIAILGAPGHADRAVSMSNRIFGKRVNSEAIYTLSGTSNKAKAKELGLTALYNALTVGLKPEELPIAHSAYRAFVKAPKSVVRNMTQRYR